jgi:cell division protein FtsQ
VEEVRKRRTQQSQQRISTVSNRVVTPVRNVRPVTMRGTQFGTPIHRQTGTRARRQFYIAMDQAGAELRLPAIPLVNPGWRILSFILVILSLVGIFSLWNSSFFQVQSVEIKGLQRLSAEEIGAVLNLENLSIVEVDANKARQAVIAQFPDLENVRLSVNLPNVVTVSATERQPVMAIQKGDSVLWADAQGIVFPARGDAGPLLTIQTNDDIPLVPVQTDAAKAHTDQVIPETGKSNVLDLLEGKTARPQGLQKMDPMILTAAQGLLQKLPAGTQLVYSVQNGMGWTDQNGCQVYIGADLSDFEVKLALYQDIASYLANQGAQPVVISVEYPNAPFYRLEQ